MWPSNWRLSQDSGPLSRSEIRPDLGYLLRQKSSREEERKQCEKRGSNFRFHRKIVVIISCGHQIGAILRNPDHFPDRKLVKIGVSYVKEQPVTLIKR